MELEFYILATGNELVSGNSIDTNSAYISSRLLALGFRIQGIRVLPDDETILKEEISLLFHRNKMTVIFMTGGLGPTEDDYTLQVIKGLFGSNTVRVESAWNKLQERFVSGKITDKVFAMASRQTYIPADAIPVENTVGIAPGFIVSNEQTTLICMPGVPDEMIAMFDSIILPYIANKFQKTKIHYAYRFLWQMNEADFEMDFINKNNDLIQKGILWGVAPKRGYLRVSFQSENITLIHELIQKLENTYPSKMTDDIFRELPELLIHNKQNLSTAESCTGGLLAKMLTDTPGSSSYMKGAIVAYSNEIKKSELGVSSKTLETFGAVSSETALEMVHGLEKKMGTDYCIAITGIAGPGGGSDEKPVGLVYIAVSSKKGKAEVQEFKFNGGRERIRELSANLAWYFLYRTMKCI